MLALGVGARRVVAQAAGTHEPLFTAEVEALRVGVDDPFQLTVTISGRSIDLKGEISAPELGNLRVLGGPSLSTQMSIINGAITQTRSYTWVLQALAPGEATVGPVRATLGEQERATSSITLEVVAGNVIERRAPARRRGFPFEDEDPLERFFDAPGEGVSRSGSRSDGGVGRRAVAPYLRPSDASSYRGVAVRGRTGLPRFLVRGSRADAATADG
jgi:hypothetical protein